MGFDTERLRHRGLLAEKREQARQLKLGIEGDMLAVRDHLDPFLPLEEIRADLAARQAVDLASKHADYVALLAEIKAIEKALGR